MCLPDAIGESELEGTLTTKLIVEVKGSWQILHDTMRTYADMLLDPSFEDRKRVLKTLGQVLGYMVSMKLSRVPRATQIITQLTGCGFKQSPYYMSSLALQEDKGTVQ